MTTWEREGVSVRGEAKVLGAVVPDPTLRLDQYSDDELLMELARRLSRSSP